jgi:hypothetical protein
LAALLIGPHVPDRIAIQSASCRAANAHIPLTTDRHVLPYRGHDVWQSNAESDVTVPTVCSCTRE